jgi:hypothetical protein
MLLRDFGPYVFYLYVGWWSFAVVKGFWALWDNIYESVLLQPLP